MEIKINTIQADQSMVKPVQRINCLSTHMQNNKIFDENKGTKEGLTNGEPFIEILTEDVNKEHLKEFNLTEQEVIKMHNERIKKTHGKEEINKQNGNIYRNSR